MEKKSKKTYSEDQVVVILEKIKSQFMAFGEGQQILSDKVDNLGIKVDNLEMKVDRIDARLARVEDDVVEIKHKLSEKVDRDEFNKLERRMVQLEKLVLAKLV